MRDFISGTINDLSRKLCQKEEELIKAALIRNGFDHSNIQFLNDNFMIINSEEDGFDHYYFHYDMPDQIRIISFQRNPEIVISQSDNNKVTIATNKSYY